MNGDVTPPQQNTNPSPEPTNETPPVSPTPPVEAPEQPETPEQSQPVQPVAMDPVAGGLGKKRGLGRRLLVAVVILALLGGAVWAAMRLNSPAKSTETPVVKKPISLLKLGVQEPIPAVFYPGIEGNTLDYDIDAQVFEGLTKFQDKTRVVPGLATSWSNPDNTTWVFKLRQGVKFHNGHVLTAQSVKDSFDASKNFDLLSLYNDTLKSVEVVDASTVKITTDGPDPLLLNKLTFLWVYDTKGDKANDSANGTGPYVQKPGSTITEDTVKLSAFDGYYGDKPLVGELDFTHYDDDESLVKALNENKLDMGYFNDETVATKANGNFKRFSNEGLIISFLVPNTLKSGSPLANKTVRQAIYTALDPAALMKSRGVIGKAANQPVPSSVPGYNPSITRPATDATKAKSLLTQAGYPNGFTAQFTYYVNSKDIALEIQKELAAVGIKLTLSEQTDGRTMQSIAYGGKTDLYYVGVNTDLIDTSDVYGTLVFQQKNYDFTKISKLNDEASVTLDQAKRLKLLQQMNATFMADYGVFPLYEPNGHYWEVRKDLHLSQQSFNGYSGVRFAEVYAE
jgi:peptide/nickel transport system substrate-binding protein